MATRPYTEYTLDDFLQDSFFRRWVNDPNPDDIAFWNQWLLEHPDKKNLVEQAQVLVAALYGMQHVPVSDEQVQREIQSILARSRQYTHRRSFSPGLVRLATVTLVCVVLGATWWILNFAQNAGSVAVSPNVRPVQPPPFVIKTNQTAAPLLVTLPDGSALLLAKNSQIRYPAIFPASLREVFLKGDAFFEVEKNPDVPFYVHAGNVVAKVLGTSFSVRLDSVRQQTTVSVRTGRVSVYSAPADRVSLPGADAVPTAVLSPKQQIIYHAESKPPVLAIESMEAEFPATEFTFESTPVAQVFAALETAYSVDISFDKLILKNCSITASLTDEPLTTKLDLICKSIGLTYQMNNNRIVVRGQGCLP